MVVTRFEFWRGANPLTPLETPPRKYLESFHANECKSWKFYYILYFNFKASQFIRQLSKQAINHSLIFRLGGFLSHLKEVCVDTQCFLVHFRVGFASYKTTNSKSKILKNNKKGFSFSKYATCLFHRNPQNGLNFEPQIPERYKSMISI